MRLFRKSLALCLIFRRSHAFTGATQIPFHKEPTRDAEIHRVAIIGAGAAGSSAAYHLAQFHDEADSNVKLDITIFEQNHMIGGRTTTVDALDDVRYPAEVGASIFVAVNHILYNASRDFGLLTKDSSEWNTGSSFELGVWDGKDMVFTLANDSGALKGKLRGLLDIAKLFWKYGWSPIKTKKLSRNAVDRFLRLYDDYFPWRSLTDAVAAIDLQEFTSVTGKDLLTNAGVSDKFQQHLVQASTRVNYGQNLDSIHGLETMVCMAIEGAQAIDGGNWQIFDEMVKRSGAETHFNTTVSSVTRTEESTFQIAAISSEQQNTYEFDTVVLAAPYQFANITFRPALISPPEKIDYVTIHVTLFTSPHRPSPSYFGLDSQDQVPDTILTTLPAGTSNNLRTDREEDAVGPTKFWSLSTLRVLEPSKDPYPDSLSSSSSSSISSNSSTTESTSTNPTPRQYLYKIFSPTPLTATLLSEIFALNHHPSVAASTDPNQHLNLIDDDDDDDDDEPISLLSLQDITWSHLRTWQSYPYLPPRTTFTGPILNSSAYSSSNTNNDNDDNNGDKATSLWYTSGIESFISTMETSALSGRNVARLIVDGFA